ncbi:putative senescence-specific cysteine protease SAG12 [Sesbania bispinosa]|nr:putative senescence-specific cysteine protease SAG12 [Sesbania bispinosa]
MLSEPEKHISYSFGFGDWGNRRGSAMETNVGRGDKGQAAHGGGYTEADGDASTGRGSLPLRLRGTVHPRRRQGQGGCGCWLDEAVSVARAMTQLRGGGLRRWNTAATAA